jgi:hypothetical protein
MLAVIQIFLIEIILNIVYLKSLIQTDILCSTSQSLFNKFVKFFAFCLLQLLLSQFLVISFSCARQGEESFKF